MAGKNNDITKIKMRGFFSGNFAKKIKKNPWIISTFALGVLFLTFLILNLSGLGAEKNIVSAKEIGEKVTDFLNSTEVELISVSDIGELYEVVVSYQEEQIPIYSTKDGEFLISKLIPLG